MLPIGHSHEPLLFKGHGGRQQWGQGSVSPVAGPYTAKLPARAWEKRPLSMYRFFLQVWISDCAIHFYPNTDHNFVKQYTKTQKKSWICSYFFTPTLLRLSLAWAQDSTPGLFHAVTPTTHQQVFLDVRSARLSLQRARLGREGWALRLKRQPEKRPTRW